MIRCQTNILADAGGTITIIDSHTHIGSFKEIKWTSPYLPWDGITPETLIHFLDESHVHKAILLPTWSFEIKNRMPTKYVIEACNESHQRPIPFCVSDPRSPGFKEEITQYKQAGCKGFGEHTSMLPADHTSNLELYRLCERLQLPILIHVAHPKDEYGLLDNVNLEAFERIFKRYSEVCFIMHGPGWWRSISSDARKLKADDTYPKGKVLGQGRAVDLLESYDNVYGDLSGYSGYNALTRDAKFREYFLNNLSHKLLYGTDLESYFRPQHSILELLQISKISSEACENILHRNIERLLGI